MPSPATSNNPGCLETQRTCANIWPNPRTPWHQIFWGKSWSLYQQLSLLQSVKKASGPLGIRTCYCTLDPDWTSSHPSPTRHPARSREFDSACTNVRALLRIGLHANQPADKSNAPQNQAHWEDQKFSFWPFLKHYFLPHVNMCEDIVILWLNSLNCQFSNYISWFSWWCPRNLTQVSSSSTRTLSCNKPGTQLGRNPPSVHRSRVSAWG